MCGGDAKTCGIRTSPIKLLGICVGRGVEKQIALGAKIAKTYFLSTLITR